MPAVQNESQVQLALQALASNKNLTLQKATHLYFIPIKTLHHCSRPGPGRVGLAVSGADGNNELDLEGKAS